MKRLYLLSIISYRVFEIEGWKIFAEKFKIFIRNKIFLNDIPTMDKYLTIIFPIYYDISKNLEILTLEDKLPGNFFCEFIILNYSDYRMEKESGHKNITWKKCDISRRFSDYCNEAVKEAHSPHILFLNLQGYRDMDNYLSKVIHLSSTHDESALSQNDSEEIEEHNKEKIPDLNNFESMKIIQNIKMFYADSGVFFIERDFFQAIGGFDDGFSYMPYINNDLTFSIRSLVYKISILVHGTEVFGGDYKTLRCLKESNNCVYEYKKGEKFNILRIIEKKPEWEDFIRAELDWITFLSDNGVNVSNPQYSLNRNILECIELKNSSLFISSFDKVEGTSVGMYDLLNPLFVQKWGEVMGKMHTLSKNYEVPEGSPRRMDWDFEQFFDPYYHLGKTEESIVVRLQKIIRELNSYPKTKDNYGLVHSDFTLFNFLARGSDIILFDFDDCRYSWFAYDIAIALFHTLPIQGSRLYESRNLFAKNFLENFFKGYRRENLIEDQWIEMIPKFLKFRQICYYLSYRTSYNIEFLNDEYKNRLATLRYLIEHDIPCLELDIRELFN